MLPIAPQNAASTKIAVTSTATQLYALMNTAGSISTSKKYYQDKNANGVKITPEDGNVRMLTGIDPTATQGSILIEGQTYFLPNQSLSDLRLICTAGINVACSVEPYFSHPEESMSASGGGAGGAGGGSGVQSGAATTGTSNTVTATNGAGGTTIVAANPKRAYTEFTNTGGVDGYYGTGMVTSSFQVILPGQTKAWNSIEALKVLSSGADIDIKFIDYINT